MDTLGKHAGTGFRMVFALLFLVTSAVASAESLRIKEAKWESGDHELVVRGEGPRDVTVVIKNAGDGSVIGSTQSRDEGDGEWRFRTRSLDAPPCRVRAEADGQVAERSVSDAGSDCDNGEPPPPPPPPPPGAATSINSTSANRASVPGSAVSEQPFVTDPAYAIVATNDLGMHCGDLDTRISSILPLFNVLHSQVILRGNGGTPPRVLGEGEARIFYSAASNPDDPAPAKVAAGEALSSIAVDSSTLYKTNFWDVASQAYDPFYPPGVLPLLPVDTGLPVPDLELFYLESPGTLHANQQNMPGISNPYIANIPQEFHEHIGTLPFFINFPFGYTAELNLSEAPGVPISMFDDFGQENPYPLMRVQATVDGQPPAANSSNVVASLDTVIPISGEAECQACHSVDVGDGHAIGSLADVAVASDDPANTAGTVPLEVSIEWASDKNILKLHDQEHGTTLITGTTEDFPTPGATDFEPVVCQKCHYTPALDLAQFGPLGPEHDPDGLANGRDQWKNKSMSNVMHSHHGTVDENGLSPGDPGYDPNSLLIPTMPPAIDALGNRRDPLTTQNTLEDSCYLCHPGKRTQCMRGAMANGGMVCQDCHGQMAHVGDDFSRNVSPGNPGPASFELAADFYDNPLTPRTPWANEPGCGGCHTGYATDNLAGGADVLTNPTDSMGNADGIRLLAAYRVDPDPADPNSFIPQGKAAPIVPTNKAFAENVVAEGTAADGNPKLYRVSTGHGGLMCEGCHGATHAEWPNADPNANDNVAAMQIQGHTGTITECVACHAPGTLGLTLDGPHGMHPVADAGWNHDHEDLLETIGSDACKNCHGPDGEGTVLSRTAAERSWECKDGKGTLCSSEDQQITVPKGTVVSCIQCHENEINHD